MRMSLFIVLISSMVCSSCMASNKADTRSAKPAFSVPESVTKDYTEDMDPEDKKRISYVIKDINGDGLQDIIYFSVEGCGNTGCYGTIYLRKKNGYCAAGTIHEESVKEGIDKELDCTIEDGPILH